MKIAFFGLEKWEKEYIQNHAAFKKLGAETLFFGAALERDHIPQDTSANVISIFINSQVDKAVLDAFPNLKLITTRSTGFDHIDFKACKTRGVLVANVPSYGEDTVAEYTFGLILSVTRRICQGYDRIRETGSFSKEGLRGIDLKGKTLGVIGTGRIGRNVIQIAKGFEMRIIASDTNPDKQFAAQMGFEYLPQTDVFAQSDILTLHVPYNKHTHYLVNANNIAKIKRGAYFINTSRGGIVETAALVGALKTGHLAGAALDVLEEESAIGDELELLLEEHADEHDLKAMLANHVLMEMPNVIITPHNAFNTWGALKRILDTTIENIGEFQKGNLINLVS